MVRSCAVLGCTNKYKGSGGISFHRFPENDSVLRELLITATGQKKLNSNWTLMPWCLGMCARTYVTIFYLLSSEDGFIEILWKLRLSVSGDDDVNGRPVR